MHAATHALQATCGLTTTGTACLDLLKSAERSATPDPVGSYLSTALHDVWDMFAAYASMPFLAWAVLILTVYFSLKIIRKILGLGATVVVAGAALNQAGERRERRRRAKGRAWTQAEGDVEAAKGRWRRRRSRRRGDGTEPGGRRRRRRAAGEPPASGAWPFVPTDPYAGMPVVSANPWAGQPPLPWPPPPQPAPVIPQHAATQAAQAAWPMQRPAWQYLGPPAPLTLPLGPSGFTCSTCGGELHRVEPHVADPATGRPLPGYGLECVGRRRHGRQESGCGRDWT